MLILYFQSYEYRTKELNTNLTLCVSSNVTATDLCSDLNILFSLSSQNIEQIILAQDSFTQLQYTKVMMDDCGCVYRITGIFQGEGNIFMDFNNLHTLRGKIFLVTQTQILNPTL